MGDSYRRSLALFAEHLNMQHLETRQLRKHYAAKAA